MDWWDEFAGWVWMDSMILPQVHLAGSEGGACLGRQPEGHNGNLRAAAGARRSQLAVWSIYPPSL